METIITTLINQKFQKVKVKVDVSWQQVDHLYYIDDLLIDKIVIIDSLFQYIDIVDKKNIKITFTGIYTNIIERYSCPISKKGKNAIREKYYEQFRDDYMKKKLVVFSICPTFACNLACAYCFEKNYHKSISTMNLETLHIIEEKIVKEIKAIKQKYPDIYINLELFGGEPIQNKNRTVILEFLSFARKINCGVSIISNGYELLDFVLDLVQYRDVIGQICVTLDGTKSYHDKLRITTKKEGTFDKIVDAVDLYLKLGINVQIATNVCKDNIDSLGELFDFYKIKGWLDNPLFVAYIGRVFSRNTKDIPANILYEGKILEKIIALFPNEKPQWLQLAFLKSAEFLATQLGLSYNQNEYGKANYHYCWATSPILLGYYVDSELKTYRCTTTVSNEKYSIGNLQDVTYDSYLNIPFFSKNIFSDDKCLTCSLGGFCGGGCILEREYRGDLVCLYEKNSFEDFIEQIFKPQLKALYERNLF